MISFKKIDELRSALGADSDTATTQALGHYADLSDSEEIGDSEILAAISHGCLVFAVFDDDFPTLFFYPVSLGENHNENGALAEITELCASLGVRERITDVPYDKLASVVREAAHAEVEYIGDGAYLVSLISECALLDYTPEIMQDDVYLGEPDMTFAEQYRSLILDEDTNRYTGYDLRREMTDAHAEYFVQEAREEMHRGAAMTLFATVLSNEGKNLFIGECCLYNFDCRGCAEVSVRLLPEYRGRGYGVKLLAAVIKAGEAIGLRRVYTRVFKDNIPSVKMTEKLMTASSEDEEIITFFTQIQ